MRDDDRTTLRITQYRYITPVSLNPWFYDRAGEHEVVQKIRDTGRLANADAYGCAWLDGREPEPYAFEETRWQAYWCSGKHHEVGYKPPAKDYTAEAVTRADLASRRAEMAAARKAALEEWKVEYQRKQDAQRRERQRAKERRERWESEQEFWQRTEQAAERRREAAIRKAGIVTDEQVAARIADILADPRARQQYERNERAIWKLRICDHMKTHAYEQTYSQVQHAIRCPNYGLIVELCQELIREGRFHQGRPRPIIP